MNQDEMNKVWEQAFRELAYMRDKVCWALDNIDDLSRRNDVKGQLEVVVALLGDLCAVTKGESK
jgi:hypothetical protein